MSLRNMISLETLGKVGEVLSGLKDTLWMTGLLEKTKGEDGEVSYRPKPEVMRRLKIPGKWTGSHKDEVVWQKILGHLNAAEVELVNGWLEQLQVLGQNDDLIYFFGKACEEMTPEEAAAILRRYVANANTASSRKELYAAMTKTAVADHILEAKPLVDWLKEVWGGHILPLIEQGGEAVQEAWGNLHDLTYFAASKVGRDTLKTKAAHQEWKKKKRGW